MACILIHIMNNGLSVYLSLKHPEMEDVICLLYTSNAKACLWLAKGKNALDKS